MKKTTILVILALISAVSKAEDRLAWIRIFNYGEDANHGYHFLILNTRGVEWIPTEWLTLKSFINGKKEYFE